MRHVFETNIPLPLGMVCVLLLLLLFRFCGNDLWFA